MPERSDADERADPATSDLPLEDPRWIPLTSEHRRLAERLTSGGLAAADLTKAMAESAIRCIRRWGDGRELLPSGFWANNYELNSWRMDDLGVRRRMPKNRPYARVRAGVLFVWKPDIDKFWLRFELPPVPDQRLETNAAAIDPAASAASPPEPKIDAPVIAGSTDARVDDGPQRDERRSRKRGRYGGTMRMRALKVLKRIYADRSFPTRDEVSTPDLWDLFCEEWAKVEGGERTLPQG